MERPALKRLLDDICARRIDVVVVYKVDRLTRSLADFAKLVELFDAHQVSFVSVTQAFNTTTSIGRLTLNVLLSFAQFEREVTGERIRDKIAASKRKGIWMGGVVPLGYRVENRALHVVEEQAAFVRDLCAGPFPALSRDRQRRTAQGRPRPGERPAAHTCGRLGQDHGRRADQPGPSLYVEVAEVERSVAATLERLCQTPPNALRQLTRRAVLVTASLIEHQVDDAGQHHGLNHLVLAGDVELLTPRQSEAPSQAAGSWTDAPCLSAR